MMEEDETTRWNDYCWAMGWHRIDMRWLFVDVWFVSYSYETHEQRILSTDQWNCFPFNEQIGIGTETGVCSTIDDRF